MYMSFHENTKFATSEHGSALVIAVIVLAILAALGIAALDVADMNMFISANDRDTKESFFHADSGANIGHEFLEEAHYSGNSSFYESDATVWQNLAYDNCTNFPSWGDCRNCTDPEFLEFYKSDDMATYIRAGSLGSGFIEGSAAQIGAGYEGIGKSAAHGGTYTDYLIRSRRYGKRESRAEVDLGWRHLNR